MLCLIIHALTTCPSLLLSGNLRSVLASTGNSVYCCCWGPDDDQVAIGCGNSLMIKTVQVRSSLTSL